MPGSDDIIEHAADFLRRISPEGRAAARRRRERRKKAFLRIARRVVLACVAILGVAIAIGFVRPIGAEGVFLTMVAMALAAVAITLWSRTPDFTPEKVASTDLHLLPSQTGEWLEQQRPALPSPAQRQLDQLTASLDAITPQLAALDARSPEALEARRLIGDELPELVRGYQKVPPSLRRQPLNGGPSPDRQLVEGLGTIGEEIARMNARLADNDLKALATQNRFLEIKYKGDGEMGE
ncbi:hypothetical protein [Sphingomonas oryzagri]|jgi:hypothetical protein|uniref:Uncharacterized protein n=1 Tax=Sphingomonas oryzagri TaxID=3042314 RepID=A0ABT6N409_9SPHN|nr:hypothetical protein [Sphingomonas oryzagri]MDH7639812.1 hypothetical protein [Sphingomonas oryzagri]